MGQRRGRPGRWGWGSRPARSARPPRPQRPKLTVPDRETIGQLLDGARGTVHYAPLLLATGTGMRRGELLGLHWNEVDLEKGIVRIRYAALAKKDGGVTLDEPKTDRARRTIDLPLLVVEELRRVRKDQAERRLLLGRGWNDTGLVFDRGDGSGIHPDVLSRYFSRLAERVGAREVRLHDLRHAYATMMLQDGVSVKVVSEALGHTSVAFTMDVYAHVLPSMTQEAATAMDRVLGDVVGRPRRGSAL